MNVPSTPTFYYFVHPSQHLPSPSNKEEVNNIDQFFQNFDPTIDLQQMNSEVNELINPFAYSDPHYSNVPVCMPVPD